MQPAAIGGCIWRAIPLFFWRCGLLRLVAEECSGFVVPTGYRFRLFCALFLFYEEIIALVFLALHFWGRWGLGLRLWRAARPKV